MDHYYATIDCPHAALRSVVEYRSEPTTVRAIVTRRVRRRRRVALARSYRRPHRGIRVRVLHRPANPWSFAGRRRIPRPRSAEARWRRVRKRAIRIDAWPWLRPACIQARSGGSGEARWDIWGVSEGRAGLVRVVQGLRIVLRLFIAVVVALMGSNLGEFRRMRERWVTGSRGLAAAPVHDRKDERCQPEGCKRRSRRFLGDVGVHSPNVSQKKTAPAFLVAHHPLRPFLKLSPSFACGSLLAFLQPGSVQAEMVTMKLVAR